jgi:alpha-N-arabinofuranosidase
VAEAYVQSDALEGVGVPALDAVATCAAGEGGWRLALVNRDPARELECRLAIDGRPLAGAATATVLSGDSPDAYNDVEHPDRVRPETRALHLADGRVTLPPHSATVLAVG